MDGNGHWPDNPGRMQQRDPDTKQRSPGRDVNRQMTPIHRRIEPDEDSQIQQSDDEADGRTAEKAPQAAPS